MVSGGIDSCLMAARTIAGGRPVHPLYVRQAMVWEDAEEAALRRFLKALAAGSDGRLAPLEVRRLDWPRAWAGHWAMNAAVAPPGAETADDAVYLPARNLALLLQGAMLAQSVGAAAVQIGLLNIGVFPDSRPEFLRDFERTYAGATGYVIRVETPLAGLSKAELLREARADWPLEFTLSCLRPMGGRHCGRCNKCAERQRAFAAAGRPDPARYLD